MQLGLTSAARILSVITAKTELDENSGGYSARMRGELVFEDVSFGYDGATIDDRRQTINVDAPSSIVHRPSSIVLVDRYLKQAANIKPDPT